MYYNTFPLFFHHVSIFRPIEYLFCIILIQEVPFILFVHLAQYTQRVESYGTLVRMQTLVFAELRTFF